MRFFSCDFWNGSDAQCDLYQDVAGTTFPVLLNALPLGAPDMFNCGYHYVIVVDGDGVVQYRGATNHAVIEIVLETAVERLNAEVAVEDTPGAAPLLGVNYPNPFNPITSIPFEVPPASAGASIQLDVLDLHGRVVRTLVNGSRPEGRHVAVFDGLDAAGNTLPSGSYLARLRVGEVVETRTMTLVK